MQKFVISNLEHGAHQFRVVPLVGDVGVQLGHVDALVPANLLHLVYVHLGQPQVLRVEHFERFLRREHVIVRVAVRELMCYRDQTC